ncbi:hypothetical protein, conserved [Trypanosoma brucei gambiense DAL972]|uniref:Choline transporter-like protein n=1 Tax=Trypanosoma brucei gambiense (strain MHOM/CI/86/DAL972) TaxID=679716 RepID=D0A391_TRYB9|nr:hypothetical protein, conserved [Trypanosoma brucei gambiense DAL972]CBH15735.1 hypothetical protein, conserved [Trypanosoma brucei gambiense DAL972]|eukprot:XP_011777999.1 hypothetical protein, conserved [Trypanosoma brucei gambiense DAL972]
MNKQYGTETNRYDYDVWQENQRNCRQECSPQAVPLQGIPLYQGDGDDKEELKRFVVQGYKDVWAAILYILCILATIGLGIYNIVKPDASGEEEGESVVSVKSSNPFSGVFKSVYIWIAVAGGIAIAVASLSFLFMRMFPRKIIIVANVVSIIINIGGAAAAIVMGVLPLGIALLIMCAMHILWFYFARHRIPFAAELLKASIDVLSGYKAVYLFNVMLCVGCAGFTILWGYAAVPSLETATNKGDSGALAVLLLLFLMLVFFWSSQVTGNLMHVTTAGLTATWYFAGKENMPKNPTLASFKRGTTTSFGSICFGSLLVAIIRLIRWLVSTAEGSEHEILRCIFLCIIGCLERLMEYFNTYAFVHVAIYGCGYIEAAKMTWELCKQCVFSALFNDTLIDVTLNLLVTCGSLLVGSVVGLLFRSWVAFALGFAVSILVHLLIFSPVTSAVTTLFVCYAEVPEGLEHSSPDLYAALQRTDQNGTSNGAAPPRV